MDRRGALRLFAGLGLIGTPPILCPIGLYAQSPRWPSLTMYGGGTGLPLVIVNGGNTQFTAPTVAPLAESRRVVLIDLTPPSSMAPEEHTADRICADVLAAISAAGIERFAWYGYSFGAVVGLQVATRTDRVRGLICGGWPPLGAQYRETLAVTDSRAARGEGTRHVNVFYRSLQGWPEREAVSRLTCPRLAFVGTADEFDVDGQQIHIGPSVIEHRRELEQLGWQVTLLDGFRHDLGARLDIIVPLIRDFLALQAN